MPAYELEYPKQPFSTVNRYNNRGMTKQGFHIPSFTPPMNLYKCITTYD